MRSGSRRRLIKKTLTALCLPLVMIGLTRNARAKSTVYCYPASSDHDGDGYAAEGTSSVEKKVSGLACPSGYVNKADDCNDNDASVYPRKWENSLTSYDNVDNDCDGKTDEPEPVYPDNVDQLTYASGFWLPIRLNLTLYVASFLRNVYADVRYADLSYDDGYHSSGKVLLVDGATTDLDSNGVFYAWIPGRPGGVYKAYMRFHDANNKFIVASDTYYVMLRPGSSPTNNVDWARYYIVNQALKEASRSEHGELGYRGTAKVDGTQFGASRNERWCSEFYAHTAEYRLHFIGNLSKTQQLSTYFSGYVPGLYSEPSAWFTPSDKGLFRSLRPGDYLGLDPDTNGSINHSGMVLAYDALNDRLFTVEGNYGNEVHVGTRYILDSGAMNSALKGYGVIQPWMLDS